MTPDKSPREGADPVTFTGNIPPVKVTKTQLLKNDNPLHNLR